MIKLLLKPIKGSLNAVKSATKQQIPDKQERAQLLRKELVTIGDFIKETIHDDEPPEGHNIEGAFW